MANTVESA